MKVLLKSLKELDEEYGIEKFEDSYLILSQVVYPEMIRLLDKIVEAKYDKMSNSYVINSWYFDPKFVKGEIIKEETIYTIKNLDDDNEYTLSF